MIFWGGLLVIFDLKFSETANGRGFIFDILNDVVGAILILVGVCRLCAIPMPSGRKYLQGMRFVQIAAMLGLSKTVYSVYIHPTSALVDVLMNVIGLAALAGIVVFCMCMRSLARQAGMDRAQRAWNITLILFIVLLCLPVGLLYLAMLGVMLHAIPSFHFDLGPAGLLLLLVFAAPVVSLFISTSIMKKSAQDSSGLQSAPLKRTGAVLLIVLGFVLGILLIGADDVVAEMFPGPDEVQSVGMAEEFSGGPKGEGEWVKIDLGKNSRKELRVIVVSRIPGPGNPTLLTNNPRGLLSRIEFKTAPREDSGLWIDGVKRHLGTGVTLIYVSDSLPATDVPVSPNEQDVLAKVDVNRLSPPAFYLKWIKPRVQEKRPALASKP
jgi:hypothetical protein